MAPPTTAINMVEFFELFRDVDRQIKSSVDYTVTIVKAARVYQDQVARREVTGELGKAIVRIQGRFIFEVTMMFNDGRILVANRTSIAHSQRCGDHGLWWESIGRGQWRPTCHCPHEDFHKDFPVTPTSDHEEWARPARSADADLRISLELARKNIDEKDRELDEARDQIRRLKQYTLMQNREMRSHFPPRSEKTTKNEFRGAKKDEDRKGPLNESGIPASVPFLNGSSIRPIDIEDSDDERPVKTETTLAVRTKSNAFASISGSSSIASVSGSSSGSGGKRKAAEIITLEDDDNNDGDDEESMFVNGDLDSEPSVAGRQPTPPFSQKRRRIFTGRFDGRSSFQQNRETEDDDDLF